MKRVIFILLTVLALPVLAMFFTWYLNIGGVYKLAKAQRSKLVCSLDIDCPPGYICVNGRCVPST